MQLFILLQDFSPKATLSISQLPAAVPAHLGWAWVIRDQPQYFSVCCHLFGIGDIGKGGHRKFLPVSEQQLSWILPMQWEGKPQRECRGVCWGQPGKGQEMEQGHLHTCPCVWHWHTHPPLWDWKFRALQRLEGKKRYPSGIISNRKWYIFFWSLSQHVSEKGTLLRSRTASPCHCSDSFFKDSFLYFK